MKKYLSLSIVLLLLGCDVVSGGMEDAAKKEESGGLQKNNSMTSGNLEFTARDQQFCKDWSVLAGEIMMQKQAGTPEKEARASLDKYIQDMSVQAMGDHDQQSMQLYNQLTDFSFGMIYSDEMPLADSPEQKRLAIEGAQKVFTEMCDDFKKKYLQQR